MGEDERATLEVGDRFVYAEGDLLFQAMLADLQAATRSIRLESYIFASDAVGAAFVSALLKAAQRGVSVALRTDHAGSFFTLARADIRRLRNNGVDFHWSRRWTPRHPLTFNQRNHRKLLIVDDQVVYLGGFNIHAPSSLRLQGPSRWRDTHLRFVGPLAAAAAEIFDSCREDAHEPVKGPPAVGMTQLIPNSSPRCRHVWRCALHDALQEARTRIWVTTPYFVPDRRLQKQLCDAAARGIDVRLLVPGKSDVPMAQWAARAAYARLLTCGVRIYEYLPRVLHAKTMLVDDRWAAIGTANMDYRSLFVNDEINLVDREGGLNHALCELFTADLAESQEIRDAPWRLRPWSALLTESIGWMMRRWL
jgi:cardiolipin synthase